MEKTFPHRKERLILTTIEIIDELGIQALSTREIARREGISEATLFRHFQSKNELLAAVLEHFSKFDKDIFQSARIKQLKPREAISYLIKSFTEYYENYPAITSIFELLDVLRVEPVLGQKIINIFNDRTGFLKQLILEAQKAGEIRPDADCESLSDLILGYCRELCFRWRLNGHEFSLKDKTLSTLEMVLDVFVA